MNAKHRPIHTWPVPSGWRVLCLCGHESRGITKANAGDHHDRHAQADNQSSVNPKEEGE